MSMMIGGKMVDMGTVMLDNSGKSGTVPVLQQVADI